MTVDQFLARVKTFDWDRLSIYRGQPLHERALILTDMAIDEVESIIAGEPYIEATAQNMLVTSGSRSTPLPDGCLRVDNMVVLRDDGAYYYNLEPMTDPILESWQGNNRGRPIGYFVEGEEVFWDPPNPANDFNVRISGYFAVPDTGTETDTDTFPLNDVYANPTAALVDRFFEHSRGEELTTIRQLAAELLQPVINMRRRRLRAPSSGRFKWSNS